MRDQPPDGGLPAGRPGAALLDAVEVLTAVEVRDLTGQGLTALLGDLEVVSRRLAGVRARLLVALETDGTWALDGSRSFAAWLRRATASSAQHASRSTKTARALREHLPAAGDALAAGQIGVEHAHLLAAHTTGTPQRVAALTHPEIGEGFLLEQAIRMDAGDYSRLLRAWAAAADPEGADADFAAQADRQELVLAKALHGYHLQGWLTDVDGAALECALDALTGVPDASDTRSRAQRRAGALIHLARLALDSGLPSPGAAIRPHINVHVPHDTLLALARAQAPTHHPADEAASEAAIANREAMADSEVAVASGNADASREVAAGRERAETVPEPFAGPGRFAWPATPREPGERPQHIDESGPREPADVPLVIPGGLDYTALSGATPAELDDGTPIPPAILARLACDSQLARVIFGPTGEVLDVGRSRRLFPPGQRRAVIARDRRCAFPGCDAPPAHGEIHHSIWWYAQHGTTNAKNGVLLCWYHHDYVHAHCITVTRATVGTPGTSAAVWTFTRPNGTRITARDGPRGVSAATGADTPGLGR